MLEWSRTDLPPVAPTGSIALSGKITGNRKRLKFDNAEVTLDGNPGVGVLDLSIGEDVPGISGTLAFDQLDLRSFLAAFTPFTPGSDSVPGAIDVAFAEKYNLDIRLSSGQGDGRRFLLHATSRRRRRSRATSPRSTFPMRRSSAAPCRLASATTARATAATSEMRLLASDIDTAPLPPPRPIDARGAHRQGHGVADAQRAGSRLEQLPRNRRGLVLGKPRSGQHQRLRPRGIPRPFQARAASSRCARSRAGRFRSTVPKSVRRSPRAPRASRRPKPRSASACSSCPASFPMSAAGLRCRAPSPAPDAGSRDATTRRPRSSSADRGARPSSRRSSAARPSIGRGSARTTDPGRRGAGSGLAFSLNHDRDRIAAVARGQGGCSTFCRRCSSWLSCR